MSNISKYPTHVLLGNTYLRTSITWYYGKPNDQNRSQFHRFTMLSGIQNWRSTWYVLSEKKHIPHLVYLGDFWDAPLSVGKMWPFLVGTSP